MDRFKEAALNMGNLPALLRNRAIRSIMSKRVGSARLISTPPSIQNFPFDSFGQGFYIMGPDPKNLKSKPKILYSVPSFNPDESLLSFCFPTDDAQPSNLDDKEKFIQHVLTEPIQREIVFFVVYCPQAKFAPYYFCARYRANPFSMPVLSNNYTFEDIFKIVDLNNLPTFDVCLAIRANQPNHDAYLLFLEWIIRCEQYGRQAISSFMDAYTKLKDFEAARNEMGDAWLKGEHEWPVKHRKNMDSIIKKVILKPFTVLTDVFSLNIAPYPPLNWERKPMPRKDFALAVYSMNSVWGPLSLEGFLTLIQAVLLEKGIVIYSPNIQFISLLMISIDLMIYPLRIELPAVPVLPRRYSYILETDETKIVGTTEPLNEPPRNAVYVAIKDSDAAVAANFDTPEDFPPLPRAAEIASEFEQFWFDTDKKRAYICGRILAVMSGIVRALIAPVRFSRDGKAIDEERYLSFFTPDARPFAALFLKTRMMQAYAAGFVEKED